MGPLIKTKQEYCTFLENFLHMIYDIISCFEVNNGYVSYVLFAYFPYMIEYYSKIILPYVKSDRVKLCIDAQFQCLGKLYIYQYFLFNRSYPCQSLM